MLFSICCPPPKTEGKIDDDDTISPSWFSDFEEKEEASDINSEILKEESFVKVTIEKPTPNALLGIAYQKSPPKGWRYVISKVTEGGLAEQTKKLMPGQTILGVNDKSCTEWSTLADLTTQLKSSPEKVELVVTKSVTATIYKKNEATKTGIVFCQAGMVESKKEAIWVYKLASDGLFGQTGVLKVGMRVIAINGEKCPPTLAQVQDIVKEAVGHLSIVAVSEKEVPFTPMPGTPSPPSLSSLSDNDEQKL